MAYFKFSFSETIEKGKYRFLLLRNFRFKSTLDINSSYFIKKIVLKSVAIFMSQLIKIVFELWRVSSVGSITAFRLGDPGSNLC